MSLLNFAKSGSLSASMAAIDQSYAMIEFAPDCTVVSANALFCQVMGYRAEEIIGQKHALFVTTEDAASTDYQSFWTALRRGEAQRRQFKRIGKNGKLVWIEASYMPIMRSGKLKRVLKLATDITLVKLSADESHAKLEAIERSQAVIEFRPDGTILTANKNFCSAVGYELSEITGKHHSMFCEPAYAASEDYRRFWPSLAAGEFMANEFLRLGKNGKQVWIQATYNPIFGLDGSVVKVVKFATDVSARMDSINTLTHAMKQVSEGDLTIDISNSFVPTMEQLRRDFNVTIAKLRQTLTTINENAREIAANADEIKNNAGEFARRTETQAAGVEQTAAALEELTTSVADASRRAIDAGQLVGATRKNAEDGGRVVDEAIEAMDRIEQSSREISNIIGVIDEIAFQTNLLALNAGVEAARAGEAGKGFAVVAQEVRELAQRSAKAAKEIKTLISSSTSQVRNGVELVGKTGMALKDIVTRVMDIDRNVAAIAESSREQATGLKEINQAVNSMDQGTQHNAAMVEESTASSHALASEAARLFDLVGQFRIGSGQTQATSRQAPAREVYQPAPSRAPQPASAASQSRPSPARALMGRVAQAQQADNWTEF